MRRSITWPLAPSAPVSVVARQFPINAWIWFPTRRSATPALRHYDRLKSFVIHSAWKHLASQRFSDKS
jgi:hypothetical protein